MSIISQQICRVNKQKLAEGFFTKLLLTTLNSNIYISIYFALQREQEGKGGKTTYKNSQAVLNQIGKSDRHYRSGMSVFKKLGFFLKHDGYLYLNPLLDNINTKKPYEDVISFYNLLWDKPLKASIQFPGDINGLHTLEQIRSMWIEQSLKTLPNYTYDDLYDLVFNSSDSEIILSQTEKNLRYDVLSKYRNTCINIQKQLAYVHFELITEQLPVLNLSTTSRLYEVSLNKLPVNNNIPSYNKTSIYAKYIKNTPTLLQSVSNYFEEDKEETQQQPQQHSNCFTQDELFTVVQPTITKEETNSSTPSNSMYQKKYNKFSLYLIEEHNKKVERYKIDNTFPLPSVEEIEQLDKDIEACENWLNNPQRLPLKCRHLVEAQEETLNLV